MTTKRTPILINIPARAHAPTTRHYIEIETLIAEADDRPVIFLLPGGPGSDHQVYKKHSTELAEVARLVYLDPRGCGESAKGDPKSYNLNNYIDDIEEIRKQLNFAKIIVLGTSYGGVAAQGYALRYPATLAKLILVV